MNRKQRRAKNSTDQISTVDDIPLTPPPDTKSQPRKTKTLYDIAAERQAQLLGSSSHPRNANSIKPENLVHVKIGKDGKIVTEEGAGVLGGGLESETPWLDTILLVSSLSAIHFTLSVLAMHQYAEELRFQPLIGQTLFIACPTLMMLVSLFHGNLLPASLSRISPSLKNRILGLRSLVYVVMANVAGCYLIQLTNDRGYYAVMKDAPSVGTIWVWTVLEMGLFGALAGVVGPGLYAWWFGYGIL